MFTSRRFGFVASSLLAPVAVWGVGSAAVAAPVVFPVNAGGNGHSYEVIVDPSVDYGGATGAASSGGGFLASITSAAEQSFVESLLVSSGAPTGGYWFGLERVDDDNFKWQTGEAFAYNNFADGEPNDYTERESFGQVYWSEDIADDVNSRRGGWNDVPATGYPASDILDLVRAGFIVERNPVGGGDGGGEPPPAAIPLPPALVAAPLAMVIAGLAARRRRNV